MKKIKLNLLSIPPLLLLFSCILLTSSSTYALSHTKRDEQKHDDFLVYIEWTTLERVNDPIVDGRGGGGDNTERSDFHYSLDGIPQDELITFERIFNEYRDVLRVNMTATEYTNYSKLEIVRAVKTSEIASIVKGEEGGDNDDRHADGMSSLVTMKETRLRAFAIVAIVDLESTHKRYNLGEEEEVEGGSNTVRNRQNILSEMQRQSKRIANRVIIQLNNTLSRDAQQHNRRTLLEYRGYYPDDDSDAKKDTPTAIGGGGDGRSGDDNMIPNGVRGLNIIVDSNIQFKTQGGMSSRNKKMSLRRRRSSSSTRHNVHDEDDSKQGQKATFGWNLDRINQINLPLDSSWSLPNAYKSIPNTIGRDLSWLYVVDVGILGTHQELAGRVTPIHDSFPSQPYGSCNDHGTHVASIAAGTYVGVNPKSSIFDVRVLDCSGSGSLSTVLQGIISINNHCVANSGGKNHRSIVINMSLGGPGNPSTGMGLALANELGLARRNCDAVIVAAAGNEQSPTCNSLPAAFIGESQGKVMSISATTMNDKFASFSNYGTCTILNAPGVSILAASSSGNNIYMTMSGTSMASPLVAGVASMHSMLRPTNWNQQYPNKLFADNIYSKIVRDGTTKISNAPAQTTKRLLQVVSQAINSNEPDTQEPPPFDGDPNTGVSLSSYSFHYYMTIFVMLVFARIL